MAIIDRERELHGGLVLPLLWQRWRDAGLVRVTWQDDMREYGDLVRLYREYDEGDHRADLTPEMRKILRIDDDRLDNFNLNYAEYVIDKLVGRLRLTAVTCDDEAAQVWGDAMRSANRFDALHLDVMRSTLVAGDGYVFVDWDDASGRVRLTQEEAFDGDVGVIPLYGRSRRELYAAAKICFEGSDLAVYIYTAGEGGAGATVEKYYIYSDGAGTQARMEQAAETITLEHPRVPMVHFKNRARQRDVMGRSQLRSVIAGQDVLNRTLYSMVATAELTAFGMYFARGFLPDAAVAPGKIIVAGDEPVHTPEEVAQMDMRLLEQGSVMPFIEQGVFTVEQISTVTGTPIPALGGSSAQSGEALKMRETDLIANAEMAQVRLGNAWEDVMSLAAVVQNAYGQEQVDADLRWRCQWKEAALRDDAQTVQNAMLTREIIGDRAVRRAIAPVFGWDDDEIAQVEEEIAAQAAERVQQLALPGFDQIGQNIAFNVN